MKRERRRRNSSSDSPNTRAKNEAMVNGDSSESAEKAIQIESDSDILLKNIRLENDFIKHAINSIPPHIYFNNETMNEVRENKHSAMEETLEEIRLKCKCKAISKKTKQKRVKLDPEHHRTVAQIIESMGNETTNNRKKKRVNLHLPNAGDPVGIDELKLRLEAKIAALRGKPQNDEQKAKHKLKRRLSKLKMKERRKSDKIAAIPIIPTEKKVNGPKPAAKPVFNKEGKMVFSKFDFTDSGVEERKKGEYSGKNYKHLLQKVEKEKEKMKALEEENSQKASDLKQKKKWKSVLEKAEGIKVKDDPELLKKALQRKEKRKKKSAKDWTAREEAVKEKQEKKQKKRQANIQARKKEKIKNKMKKAVKKGRMIPGF